MSDDISYHETVGQDPNMALQPGVSIVSNICCRNQNYKTGNLLNFTFF
jgi:hypothetical protein